MTEPVPTPAAAPEPADAPAGSKGLKANAIGFTEGLSIGLDATAPAYSIAAVLGSIVVIAGTQAPAVLWLSFVGLRPRRPSRRAATSRRRRPSG